MPRNRRTHRQSAVLYTIEALNEPIKEDDDAQDWFPLGDDSLTGGVSRQSREDARARARDLSRKQPNVKAALDLYKSYVLGTGFKIRLVLTDKSKDPTNRDKEIILSADRAWSEFLRHNRRWWNIEEFGERVWRDGEQFTLKLEPRGDQLWPPEVRFIDPEEIDQPSGSSKESELDGIVVDQSDAVRVLEYIRVDPTNKTEKARYTPERIIHTKIGVDSNEKRGLTRFFSIIWFGRQLPEMLKNEVTHRKLQSSIVLQRKVKGSPAVVRSHLDNLKTSTSDYPERKDVRREKIRPGTILTTNEGVEVAFAQPQSNFSDSSPLLKWLVLQIAGATGFTYGMVSSDPSDANFASALVAESPVVQRIRCEQKFFGEEIRDVWEWVIRRAIRAGRLGQITEERFFNRYEPLFSYPDIVTRDLRALAQANNIAHMAGAISTSEFSRRMDADPELMRKEIEEEMEMGLTGMATFAMNPRQQDKSNIDRNNQTGQNQGDDGLQGGDSGQQARRAAQGS